jgi:hypothetical protein
MEALDVPLEMAGQVGYIGVAGAVALAVASLLWPRGRDGRRSPLPAAGLVLAAAGALAITASEAPEHVGQRQATGIALAAVGGFIAGRLPWWLRPFMVMPGVALLLDAMGLDERPDSVAPIVVTAAVLAMLVAETDRLLAGSAAGPPLMAVTIFGMYVTIPETAQILPVLVVAVPIALTGGPVRLARLGSAGSAATLALLAAIVAEGGQTRESSVLGGLASVGALALVPVARVLVERARPPSESWRSPWLWQLVAVHVVVVLVVSRVAGLQDTFGAALVIVVVTGCAALFALTVLMRDVERGGSHS